MLVGGGGDGGVVVLCDECGKAKIDVPKPLDHGLRDHWIEIYQWDLPKLTPDGPGDLALVCPGERMTYWVMFS